MNKSEVLTDLLREYKKTLNPSSKWYTEDIAQFTRIAQTRSIDQLKQQLANLSAMNNPKSKFNKDCDRYDKLLYKSGMYNMENMKPVNSLD